MLDQAAIETIVARRHRRMGGEHGIRGDRLQGGGKLQTLRNQLAAALDDLKRGMALVDMPHAGRKAQRPLGAHPADAEHDLLTDALDLAASIELIGDGAVLARVALDIRVEQVEPDVPHLGHPDPQGDDALTHLDLNDQRAALAPGTAHRQILDPRRMVMGNLVALGIDGLAEVAQPIEDAHGDKGDIQVAHRLAVVTGEDAQPAGIDREALVEPELGTGVGDQISPIVS